MGVITAALPRVVVWKKRTDICVCCARWGFRAQGTCVKCQLGVKEGGPVCWSLQGSTYNHWETCRSQLCAGPPDCWWSSEEGSRDLHRSSTGLSSPLSESVGQSHSGAGHWRGARWNQKEASTLRWPWHRQGWVSRPPCSKPVSFLLSQYPCLYVSSFFSFGLSSIL